MEIPVRIDSSRPILMSVDLRGLANLYACLSAEEQAQFFELVAEEIKTVCNELGHSRDWYQRDMIAIELGKRPKAQEFVRHIATSNDEVPQS